MLNNPQNIFVFQKNNGRNILLTNFYLENIERNLRSIDAILPLNH